MKMYIQLLSHLSQLAK